MSKRRHIEAEVIRVLREYCGVTREIRGDSRLQEDLGLDSTGLLTLALEVENAFQLMLEEAPDSPPETIDELVDLVFAGLSELADTP